MTVTDRQYIAMHLYYVNGQSHRRIGDALGISHQSVQRLIARGSRWLVEQAARQGGATLPMVRALTAPGPTSSVTNVGLAASRRDELLDTLELRMEQRAKELADIEECMSGGSFYLTRVKRNPYDQWELCYLETHAGEPLPTSAYYCGEAARYCKGSDVCGCECARCKAR